MGEGAGGRGGSQKGDGAASELEGKKAKKEKGVMGQVSEDLKL